MWAGYAGTYFWVDPKEEIVGVYMTQAPSPVRAYYRRMFSLSVARGLMSLPCPRRAARVRGQGARAVDDSRGSVRMIRPRMAAKEPGLAVSPSTLIPPTK